MEPFSTFLHLLCLLSTPLLCGATEYYVRPTEPTNTTCPGQPCHTLSQYISDSDFLWSNTVLRFLSGTHQVNGSIIIENACNVLLMAQDKCEESQVVVYSQQIKTPKQNDMLFFNVATNITIDSLSFVLYPQDCADFTNLRLHFKETIGLHVKNSEIRSANSICPCNVVVRDSQNVEISSLSIYYGKVYLFHTQNIHITTAYNQCENVSTLQLADIGIVLDHVNNTVIQNMVLRPNDAQTSGIGLGVMAKTCYNMTVAETTVSSFINPYPHFLTTVDIGRQPAVIELRDSEVNVRNCNFSNNNLTALKLVRTSIKVLGNLTFVGNRAYKGAAMIFIESYMILTRTCYVTFMDNVADDTGGAIYILPERAFWRPPYSLNKDQSLLHFIMSLSSATKTKCFLTVQRITRKKQLIFINNSARQGGDALFGGSLGTACTSRNRKTCGKCLNDFQSISTLINTTLSAISSDPTRVCFCNESNMPDCLIVSHAVSPIYPGQTTNVSAVIEGHNFGTAVGSIFAQFLENETSLHLKEGQSIQEVQQHACNQLYYTIFMEEEVNHAVLILTAKKRNLPQHLQRSEDAEFQIIEEYTNGSRPSLKYIIQELSVYLKIILLPCPAGFELTHKPLRCDCNKYLQLLQSVKCDIQRQEIQRRGLVWVGPLTDDNNTIIDVMTSHNCPLNYCKYETLNIILNQSEKQCNYNHSGILCGGCQPGLSLALGSAQCLQCSNEYLALLIPFALAGFVLVFFIKTLDLTTSMGFINGLIFYANILKPNEHVFLHQTKVNPLTLFIAWLNLDLGIETCFVDGLTAYWKTWLQFVFPFYVWAIAGLIIISARYSTRLARVMGNNSVPVLATLFLLSYAKLLRTIITILSYTVVETPHGQKTVWSADGNIDYMGPQHGCLFVAAIATLLLLWLPYTLLLLLGQWLHKINQQCVTRTLMKMKPFLDAHYGPLKDKHHYWFGVLLCMRVIVLLVSAVVPANNCSVFTLSMSITAGALISVTSIGPAVYHNNIVSTFEVSLFINLGLLSLTKFYTITAGGDQAAVTYTLIAMAFIQFLGLVLYQISSLLKPLFSHCRTHDDDDDEATENIWRYNTSVELSLPKWKTLDSDTPYQDAATTL